MMLNGLIVAFALIFAGNVWAQDKADPLKLITIWAGTLPIVLSAPHGGREPIHGVKLRQGRGVSQFTTGRDSNTAELAEEISGAIENRTGARPFVVIARFDRKYIDVNRAPEAAFEDPLAQPYYDAYHRALAAACDRVRNRWGRGVLLDVHGQGAETGTIFRGTGNGKSVADLERRFGRVALTGSKSILGQLALKGYRVVPPGDTVPERRYTGGYITQTYGSHRGTGIDVIQLEFGTALRQKRSIAQTARDVADALIVFANAYLPASGAERENGTSERNNDRISGISE